MVQEPRRLTSWADYLAVKRNLIRGLSGTVLELGAGRGANFGYLAPDIDWIGLEPHDASRRILARTAAGQVRTHRVLDAPAEHIPLPTASVDAVLCTVVLCSVTDPEAVLAEVRRVLRPGGRFVFVEHIGAPEGTGLRRLQRVLSPLTRRFDRGCNPTRATDRTIEEAGFRTVELERFQGLRRQLSSPFIAGTATT
ncbi:ubiquinone/menaquinone biosynthesis C-methylase UbiE [Kribbella amoyensis]|uniref:Ubiquinone/menaquinone biosynthesis C-methylase UbiE n=1 Tax=Kribbella amoyensis TaxID=996641 RepID=A0A561C0S5_9ACTN|nr:class I SAM-dependent methyltransferase [Kribbella amoyensis]TWD84789.1 ubiquinone/menaquinone biosynthesis C-methylase UbiE [Kribbella amoyensis]